MLLEAFVIAHLSDLLSVPVYAEVPEALPAFPFVIVERTGSWKGNRIPGATLAIQSYAASLLQAAELNERVKGAMQDLAAENEICACRLNSDYNYSDSARKRYRYQAVFDVTYYD